MTLYFTFNFAMNINFFILNIGRVERNMLVESYTLFVSTLTFFRKLIIF